MVLVHCTEDDSPSKTAVVVLLYRECSSSSSVRQKGSWPRYHLVVHGFTISVTVCYFIPFNFSWWAFRFCQWLLSNVVYGCADCRRTCWRVHWELSYLEVCRHQLMSYYRRNSRLDKISEIKFYWKQDWLLDTPVGDIKPEKSPLVLYKNNGNDPFFSSVLQTSISRWTSSVEIPKRYPWQPRVVSGWAFRCTHQRKS